MLTLSHKNLEVWKQSIQLVKEIYTCTSKFPKEEIYGLISQMRRSSISIPSNIAVGLSRKSTIEKRRFLEISRSSLVELDTQIEITMELGMNSKSEIENISKLSNSIFAMLTSLIKKI